MVNCQRSGISVYLYRIVIIICWKVVSRHEVFCTLKKISHFLQPVVSSTKGRHMLLAALTNLKAMYEMPVVLIKIIEIIMAAL